MLHFHAQAYNYCCCCTCGCCVRLLGCWVARCVVHNAQCTTSTSDWYSATNEVVDRTGTNWSVRRSNQMTETTTTPTRSDWETGTRSDLGHSLSHTHTRARTVRSGPHIHIYTYIHSYVLPATLCIVFDCIVEYGSIHSRLFGTLRTADTLLLPLLLLPLPQFARFQQSPHYHQQHESNQVSFGTFTTLSINQSTINSTTTINIVQLIEVNSTTINNQQQQ